MDWFLAKIIYRITCARLQHAIQFDEQLYLLQAPSEEEAFTRATEMGRGGEARFLNSEQQLVAWTYVNVSELICVGNVLDGTELYSQVREADDATDFINFVHYKASRIRERLTP